MLEEQYQPDIVEQEAQEYWSSRKVFEVKEDISKEKFYCLSMFPYPSGYLHVGHARNYTIGDVIARYQRMLGKNVMQPMGWDAFGLPAENAAIKNRVPPAQWTYQNIDFMRAQFKRLGFAYDWKREIATCKPEYYRWEQWLFTKLFKKGLVYRKNSFVNWDPVDQTVLANEQVINGCGWRSGAPVERREIPQWFLKITDYAEELLSGLDKLDQWPEQVRTMQRNWIGRSEGVELTFKVPDHDAIKVFTTRPDTLLGATYLAIAPTHPLATFAAKKNKELQTLIQECSHIKMAEAELATLEKKGVATGLQAIHPLNGEALPIWVANFVVMDYGFGAVMAVPAHDQRDFEFAQKYHLPIQQVIAAADGSTIDLTKAAFTEKGILVNSAEYTGLTSEKAFQAIADYLQSKKIGKRKINYRLRDWSISRQRYWGAPIPIIYCKNCGPVTVLEKDLPVVLPENVEFTGTSSPLKNMPEFHETTCPECGQQALRETDTFDTFMESSWYYARFASYNQHQSMLDDRATYWTPVDHYVGGIEHAVLHLLYSRFLHKVLRDEGLLNSDEPFIRLLTQGMVLKDGAKMSKSKGNTVNPEELMQQYGADTVRLFTIFAAPPEQNLEWSDAGVEGCHRFLKRLWSFAYKNQNIIQLINDEKHKGLEVAITLDKIISNSENVSTIKLLRDTHRQLHEILQKARFDMDKHQFNTIVAASMKILNLLSDLPAIADNDYQAHDALHQQLARMLTGGLSIMLRLLAPIAPHITHVLWRKLEFGQNIIAAGWPKVNKNALKTAEIEIIIQVNGKLRGKIAVPVAADASTIESLAMAEENVQRFTTGKKRQKAIVVPGKLINIVVQD